MENGIDPADGMLTVASFPWKDPSSVAGAVRRSDDSGVLTDHNVARTNLWICEESDQHENIFDVSGSKQRDGQAKQCE
jgi:hypothetical protein